MLAHYSYKFFRLASLLALLALGWALPAYAEEDFSVDKVVAEADGVDTSDARKKALAQGEIDAFRQLIARLVPDKDMATDIVTKTTPVTISSMVHGFEVGEEKMTAEHYRAVLRYHFSPQSIKALLPQNLSTPNQTAASTARKAVLILPVMNEGRGVIKLWQDDNKWRNIWYESALESGGGLVVVPLGDINDRVDVDDSNIADATTQTLSRLYDRYGAGEIHILTAFYNLKADPKPALEIAVKRLSLSAAASETSSASYTIRSTETLETLMARASNDIARNIYKQQTIDKSKIEFERQKEMSARANVSGAGDWVQLRKHLLAHGNVVNIRLTSMTNSQIFMIISYKGTPEMLGKTLVASGLRVMQDGDSLVLALQ
jgi:Uncharacterized protein conserved in bacteria (DUF2066)